MIGKYDSIVYTHFEYKFCIETTVDVSREMLQWCREQFGIHQTSRRAKEDEFYIWDNEFIGGAGGGLYRFEFYFQKSTDATIFKVGWGEHIVEEFSNLVTRTIYW